MGAPSRGKLLLLALLAAALGACTPMSAEHCATVYRNIYLPPGVSGCPSSNTEGCCVTPAVYAGLAAMDASTNDAADDGG